MTNNSDMNLTKKYSPRKHIFQQVCEITKYLRETEYAII